jgi:hypothetical protein
MVVSDTLLLFVTALPLERRSSTPVMLSGARSEELRAGTLAAGTRRVP